MTEKEIKMEFIENHLNTFKNIVKRDTIRVYAIELPLDIGENKKFADIVLINEDPSKSFNEMQMFVLEFKKNKIEYGPIDQLHMYVDFIHKRFYRKNPTVGILIAPKFSAHEISQCKKYGYHALQLDNHFNMRFLI